MNKLTGLVVSLIVTALLSGCAGTSGKTVEQRRAEYDQMAQSTLAEMKQRYPEVAGKIAKSAGYGVFSNANVNVVIASISGGYGIVHNTNNNEHTYMNMGEAGIGFGIGIKDFKALIIFKTTKAYEIFRDEGWVFGAQAEASAKTSDNGDSTETEVALGDMEIYLLTESGLALQATIKGTRFWPVDELN